MIDSNASDCDEDVESWEDVEKIVNDILKPRKTDFSYVINNLHIKS